MEHLWSQAGATSRNRSQMAQLRKRLKQADRQPVATHSNRFMVKSMFATACQRLPTIP